MAPVDIEDVWNMLGFGRMQLAVFFTCCVLQMYITNEQLGLSVILVASACELKIDNERMGWLIACVFFAQVLFGHFFGYLSDKIGRLKVLLSTTIMTILSSFLSAFMPEYWSFLVLRCIVGIFITGIAVTLLTYLSEFISIALRPKVHNFVNYAIGVSMIYVPVVALILMYSKIHVHVWENYAITNWRVLILVNLLPGIIGVCLLYRIPESPKYYLSVHKHAEAMAVLEKCCRANKGKNVTLASLGVEKVTQPRLSDYEIQHNGFTSLWYDTVPLFKGEYLRYMILTSISTYILFGAGFGLTIWVLRIRFISQQIVGNMILCDLLDQSQNSNITLEQVCDINLDSMMVSIVQACTTLTVLIIITILLLFLTRRTILLIFTLLGAFVGCLLNFVQLDAVIIAVFIMFIVLPLCCLRLAISILIDLVPTHLRAKGVAVIFLVGRIGVMTSSLFVGYTLKFCCLGTFNAFVLGLLEYYIKHRDDKNA
ncbi:synaptic vesicle glycoprotein 2B-like isoform X2 [Drosophila tropicalis]|uniref:synaptic vesicle glycoprotein 2B-like isoform X2 n=1 Tax=Drosophila tropicalis TaxID=46794 RepID=UPI0035AC048D